MLYRYIVKNFMSFKEKAELSMFPITHDIQGHLLEKETQNPVLRTAVIYGANAAGKSSLIKSIYYAKNFILNNNRLSSLHNPCYKLDNESINLPSLFSFEIKINRKIYQYGFTILFSKAQVIEEWLYELGSEEVCCFYKKRDDMGKMMIIDSFSGILDEDKTHLRIYDEEVSSKKEGLLLTKIGEVDYGKGYFWETCRNVFLWFKKLHVFFPESRFNLLSAVNDDEDEINKLYNQYFKKFGIDIDNIHLNRVPISLLKIDEDVMSEIRKDLFSSETRRKKAMININGQEYLLEVNDFGEITAKEVKFSHKENGIVADFAKNEESDGTQRLFDLIPVLSRLVSLGGVVIIDEIDRSLHSLLTRNIIQLFLRSSEENGGQLICTTHDVKLLDLTLLRQDEIWFVHKDPKKSSVLYPLAKYKVNYPENVEANYLAGVYKAMPKLDNFVGE